MTSVSGAGTKMALVHDMYGSLSETHQQQVIFLCTAAASKGAWEGANTTISVSDVQSFANEKVGALITEMTASKSRPCKDFHVNDIVLYKSFDSSLTVQQAICLTLFIMFTLEWTGGLRWSLSIGSVDSGRACALA